MTVKLILKQQKCISSKTQDLETLHNMLKQRCIQDRNKYYPFNTNCQFAFVDSWEHVIFHLILNIKKRLCRCQYYNFHSPGQHWQFQMFTKLWMHQFSYWRKCSKFCVVNRLLSNNLVSLTRILL